MQSLIDIVAAITTGVLVLPAWFLIAELLCSLPAYRPRPQKLARWPSLAVLMPAHDEAAQIGGTLEHLMPQLAAGARVVVVAHNCSDDTAGIARLAGAEVVIVDNAQERGKGYALAGGVRHLAADPPDIVVVLDADCRFAKGSIEQLAASVSGTGRPAQAHYAMLPSQGGGLGERLAAFAFAVRNYARPLGLKRMGLPCHLMGTGMAFPWRLFAAADLGREHLVEDLRLGVALVQQGSAPVFCPEAVVSSHFPASAEGARSQRTRWEHGHLEMLAQAPRLLVSGLKTRRWDAVSSALDLAIPPLSFLVYVLAAGTLAAAVLSACGLSGVPLAILAASIAGLMISLGLVWWRYGRAFLPAAELWAVPLYVLKKFGVYLSFFRGRQRKWVRTDRS